MKDFLGKIAVVTGGGSGMGREIVRQLVADGCNVAMCDVSVQGMAETKRLCESGRLLQGQRITTHLADVSDEAQVLRFRDEVAVQQETDHIHLLFNNAGVTGGGSMFTVDRAAWDRTFAICWGGRLPQHSCLSAYAAEVRRGAHRQHEQRQWLLGVSRPICPAHGIFGSEVRGKGLH